MFISILAVGLFLTLGVSSAFAAAGDHAVTGGNTVGGDTTLPAVGATSEALATVTIASTGGDDIADTEVIKISINTSNYPNLVFDTSVTTATIAGTFGATAHTGALSYNATETEVTLTLTTGGGNDADGETVTVAGLKIGSIYESADLAAFAVVKVECETTANDTLVTSTSTLDAAGSAEGALSSLSMTPDTYANSALSTYTVAFTSSAVSGSGSIPNNGNLQITFPSGYDLTGMSGTASNLSGLDGTWTISVAGQVLTLTQSGGAETAAGAKSLRIANVRNPAAAGSSGTFTVRSRTGSTNVQAGTPAAITISVGTSSSIVLDDIENLAVTDNEGGGVMITWNDPADDATTIQILKGTAPFLVDGTVYANVPMGTGYYVDTNVEEGDVVTYQLRGTDGSETGNLSDEVTFTVGSSSSDEDATDGADDTSDAVVEEVTDETSDSEDASGDSSDDSSDSSDDSDDSSATVSSFSDTEDHWAMEEIEVMVDAGVVEGNPDGSFDPDGSLNRAEAAALLWRVLMMGDPSEATEDPFSDVSMMEWYAAYIAGLKSLELVQGNPDGTYEPSEDINRAEFLQLAVNVFDYLDESESEADYDVEMVLEEAYEDMDSSAWYANTVAWATSMGYVEGVWCELGGKCFNASSSITRAEATKILYNMFADAL